MSWDEMTLFEQLSEVAGDIKRCVDSKEKYLNHESPKDFSFFYYDKAYKLVLKLRLDDKEYRRREFLDELFEVKEYISQERNKTPILNYWMQFDKAVV